MLAQTGVRIPHLGMEFGLTGLAYKKGLEPQACQLRSQGLMASSARASTRNAYDSAQLPQNLKFHASSCCCSSLEVFVDGAPRNM